MQQFKRFTALVMAAVMALSLAGCGGSGGTTAQNRPQAAPQLQQPVQRPTATTPMPTVPEATEEEALRLDFLPAVEALRAIDGILMVDYNYEVRTADIGDYAEIPADLLGNSRIQDQWYLNSCGIHDGMEELSIPGGSSSVIVAVIDTGVDYDHEDLADNIWKNENEIPDNGIDDDGNGYIDDCYGVNIVTGTVSGDDDNGHSTHVAGIIAAQNNNLGTVGIAYNVKIMPVKAAMASGYLHQSDIARAILYAHQHGAQVINMSFGGTASSIAVQDALAMAYADCVLVASAGNDGAPNEGIGAIPNYPAALSYVLGVMSVGSTGRESSFSNYDAYAFNGVEYELYAPGEYLLSTIPGDGYASWSGTSMAAPVVAAMAALLRSEYPDAELYPTKFIYGQLSATSGRNADCLDVQLHGMHNLPKIVDLKAALTALPEPQVGVSDYYAFDTEGFEDDTGSVNNGDGVVYYYNFTVVKTDLSESTPFGKITIQALDTTSTLVLGEGSGLAAADFQLRYDPRLLECLAVENKITSGMTPTTFEPDRTCTRGQVVTFLYRTFLS